MAAGRRTEKAECRIFPRFTQSGHGYPEELLQSGPKPFGKMKEDSAHFGMGLYSSLTLCQKHGGTLALENRQGYGAEAAAS